MVCPCNASLLVCDIERQISDPPFWPLSGDEPRKPKALNETDQNKRKTRSSATSSTDGCINQTRQEAEKSS